MVHPRNEFEKKLTEVTNFIDGPIVLFYAMPPTVNIVAALGARVTSIESIGCSILLGCSTRASLGADDATPVNIGFRDITALTLFKGSPERYRKLYSEIRMAPIEAVDLNCFIYIQRTVLSKLAEQLGLQHEAEEYRRLAGETIEGIRRHMWDSETGFCYDVLEEDHKLIRVKSPAAFTTMYAEVASRKQAEKLLEHPLSPREFWTRFPLPTVSADDLGYDPRGYWRGRSWINYVWFTYQGLKRYGFKEEARRLAEKVLDTMASGPNCNENYDTSTRQPLGAPDFGWSTLTLSFLADFPTSAVEDR